MISFESPALWSLHIIWLLWGWTRGERSREGRGRVGWSLPVKAAEQKEKTINSIQDWEAVVSPDFHKALPSPEDKVCWTVNFYAGLYL